MSEQEVHWRSFLQHVVARGLCGVQLIISDDHAGLEVARKAVFGGIPWQRCQYHLQHAPRASAYVPRRDLLKEVAADIRTVNGLERVSQEVKRRTHVVGIFPHEASCLRLVSAILMEIDEKWQVGRTYLNPETEDPLPW